MTLCTIWRMPSVTAVIACTQTREHPVDRAYRIGQTRDVIVYRLISCGSVEEKIYRKQVLPCSARRELTQLEWTSLRQCGATRPLSSCSDITL
jgi:hypothetical protein